MKITPEQARSIAEIATAMEVSFVDVCKQIIDNGIQEFERRLKLCQQDDNDNLTSQE